METPVPRTVMPSSTGSQSIFQGVSGTALTQRYQALDDNADAFSGDNISMDGLEDQ